MSGTRSSASPYLKVAYRTFNSVNEPVEVGKDIFKRQTKDDAYTRVVQQQLWDQLQGNVNIKPKQKPNLPRNKSSAERNRDRLQRKRPSGRGNSTLPRDSQRQKSDPTEQSLGGITIPGYPHLGPGNKVAETDSKNPVDKIAQDHDKSYNTATSLDDIISSDKKATAEFASKILSKDGIAASIGATGLGVKLAAEELLGNIYPSGGQLHSNLLSLRARSYGKRRNRWLL